MLKGEVVRTTASLIAIVSVAIGAYIYLDSQKKGIEKKIELLDDKIKLVQKKIEGNENKVLFSSEITKNNNSILDLKTSVEDLNSRFTAIENKQHIPIVEAPKDKRSSTFIDLSASDIALRSSDKNLKEAALQKWGGNVQLLKRSGNYCMGLSDDSATIVEMDVENSPKEWSLNLSYVLKGSGFSRINSADVVLLFRCRRRANRQCPAHQRPHRDCLVGHLRLALDGHQGLDLCIPASTLSRIFDAPGQGWGRCKERH
jgi:hypothetical protein